MIISWPLFRPVDSERENSKAEEYSINNLKIPAYLLIENAGCLVATRVIKLLEEFNKKLPVTIFCGPGNNGADGLACARHLASHGLEINIIFISPRENFKPELTRQFDLLNNIISLLSNSLVNFYYKHEDLKHKSSIIIDAIFGAGIRRPPEKESKKAIEYINKLREDKNFFSRVISIDVPSGLSLESQSPKGVVCQADLTITFEHLKRCHVSEPTKKYVGKVEVFNIGLFYPARPTNFYIKTQKTLNFLLKPIQKTSHKGLFGHVAVVEGCPNLLGASRLAARAALRAGAGLVTIIGSRDSPHHASDLAEFMKISIEHADDDFFRKLSCLVVGPGLGNNYEKAIKIINKASLYTKNIIIDADALKLIKNNQLRLNQNIIICTPQPKEAAKLLAINTSDVEDNRFLALENLSRINFNPFGETIWILKGATTLIHEKSAGIIALCGEAPILSIGGSGDVLAGAIGALIAQTHSPLAAAVLGVNLQISAALRWPSSTKGILPSELADTFASLLKRPGI